LPDVKKIEISDKGKKEEKKQPTAKKTTQPKTK
jgi:hypothetical protein